MKSVFVIWKDIKDGMWHPVAQLTRDKGVYCLSYTKGASHPNFIPFPRMEDKESKYFSNELFAFFKNRILPSNRPEFRKLLEWSDLNMDTFDELDVLGVSGGARKTDVYRIIPKPTSEDGNEYKVRFFTSGVSHLDDYSLNVINKLVSGDKLLLKFEDENPYDDKAILVTSCDKIKVGYCPKYYNCDIRELLKSPELIEYNLKTVKVNLSAPSHFRLLCEFSTKWPEGFIPFVSNDYLKY